MAYDTCQLLVMFYKQMAQLKTADIAFALPSFQSISLQSAH
jgi:hypothetical protein